MGDQAKFGCGGLLAFGLLVLVVGFIDYRCDTANQRVLTGTVASKYVKRYGDTDRFMVEIDTKDGVDVVQVRDSIWYGDFRSADRYAKFKEGEQVTVTVAGYRNGFLSLFPRVVK